MKDVIIVETEFITIKYLADHETIYHVVHKPVSGQPFRDALTAGADYLKANGITKWLSDDRKNGEFTQEDLEWGTTNWNQPMIDAGWKYWANVIPTELHAAGSLQPAINDLHERGLRMNVFVSVEQALEWLDNLE